MVRADEHMYRFLKLCLFINKYVLKYYFSLDSLSVFMNIEDGKAVVEPIFSGIFFGFCGPIVSPHDAT